MITDADGTDEEISSWNVAYTVSDDLSISYGMRQLKLKLLQLMKKLAGFLSSYTTGGVTLSASQFEASAVGNTTTETASTGDKERWSLSATFAF